MNEQERSKTPPPPPTPIDKWETQLRKGGLELAILASLWAAPLYGLEIIRQLDRDSALVLSEGTVYPLLARLKSEGLLDSEWVEADAGHPRKYYRLTPRGRQRVREMAQVWSEFAVAMKGLLSVVLRGGTK